MARARTRPSLSRMLTVGAGTLSIGFAGTVIAQRPETPPPLSAAPRTSSYPLPRSHHPRTEVRFAHVKARGPAPPKRPFAAPGKARHASARTVAQAQRAPAPAQPQATTPAQPAAAAPAPTQVVIPAEQPQPTSGVGVSGLQAPAQAPTPALAAPTSVVSGGS